MAYLNWDTKLINDFSEDAVGTLYDSGYVFTRVDNGVMNRTRSFRVRLHDFEMTSENRRIARKNQHLALAVHPLPFAEYSWKIGKLAKDFYDELGADFSANKVKELLTNSDVTNFNTLLAYTDTRDGSVIGYAICYVDSQILHYSYPFYKSDPKEPSRGLGMMIQALEYAKAQGLIYAYLGSLQRSSDTYKLQFKGGEWFDGEKWQTDIGPLKEILKPH